MGRGAVACGQPGALAREAPSELDLAVRLGRRAVLLGDESLRPELAAWHCQLGQLAAAVGVLLPLLESPGLDRSRLLMRVALYWARLGAANETLAALREAAAYNPENPLIHELRAMVFGWAPDVVSALEAADDLRAGRCRRERDDAELGFEDLLRAFDIAPEHTASAEALAQTFVARGHPRVADEVWRRHADALGGAGVDVHRARLAEVLAVGNSEWALAAAFDARLDTSVDGNALIILLEQELGGSGARARARLVVTEAGAQRAGRGAFGARGGGGTRRLALALPRGVGALRGPRAREHGARSGALAGRRGGGPAQRRRRARVAPIRHCDG